MQLILFLFLNVGHKQDKECSGVLRSLIGSVLETRLKCVFVCSMEFQYLKEVPVLTLDVNDDFKDKGIKCADMIEKV